MSNSPNFLLENSCGKTRVVGIDEAGCGPWAGPVVAAALMFFDHSNYEKWQNLNDSKKLTVSQRQEYFKKITLASDEIVYGIGIASVDEIDSLNISGATLLAMERAVSALSIQPEIALIDGIRAPKLDMPIQLIKKGDSISLSIAAASIIAKVSRDAIMRTLDKAYPQYGWGNNAGYGTAQHINAIQEHGITEHHRKSFAPIKNYIKEAA
jgi:ribonuclease HII